MFEIVEVLVQSERAIAQLLRLQHSCYHCCCRFGSVSSRRLGPAFKVGLNFVRHFGSFKTARLFITVLKETNAIRHGPPLGVAECCISMSRKQAGAVSAMRR